MYRVLGLEVRSWYVCVGAKAYEVASRARVTCGGLRLFCNI